ncbi:mucin-2-like [Scyliorhinus canicula]|uniref:mucin-2-like n=1 Tax=Scyliorhinus canicula TaxID=7830 RepID=UPI0018F2A569|nr:mucin-2-like [Scyliorhinus canicula]
MKYYLLLIIVILSPIKSLDASVHSLDPRSVEATPPYGSVGSCYTWGRGAFRTFQDDFFYFTSRCNFILSRQCKGPAEDFNIQIRRGSNGNLEHIHMLIEGVSIITENETVRVKDEIIKLPYDDKIITVQKYGVYTRITNRKHSISLIWNHHDSLSITLDIKYKNQTCGLCGGFQEGAGINTDSDEVIYNIMVANQLDVLGHVCVTGQQTSSACTAANSCISPISMYFSTCFANPTFTSNYLELCQRDVCACGNMKECTCATFEELARQCTDLPAISDDDYEFFGPNWKEWRSTISCGSPACPENQFYKECGAMCVPTCSDPETQQQCDQCVNACECPKGTVLDDIRDTGRCIDKTACPCEYGGMIYNPEQLRNTSCHSCVCRSGMWECSDISCPGRCKIEEGTHFTTFDNKYYTLKGDCTYFAVVTKSWNVMIELRPCQIAFEQTCLQRVMFTDNQTWYAFTNDGNVYSEGNKIGLPFTKGDITIFQQSSMFLQVATNSGMKMQIQISPIMQLYISLPEDAQGSTKGLCGTFNDNANDDFLSAHNIVEDAPLSFANSWEAENDCPETEIPAPCVSSENEHYAQQHCSYLKDPVDAFSVCHPTVDYMKYYQMCVAATCACENIKDCLCAALGAYVHECAAHGVIVRSWRKDICNKSCSNSQVFENDMRTCNRTCRSLSESDYTCSIKDIPVYGCGCPEKKYMDENGVCVDRSDCSCYTEGRLIEKGQSINMHGIPCICRDGKLHCFPATSGPWPPGCPHGKVFVDCTNGTASSSQYFCGKTCRTLSTPCSPCVPDCVCPHGLVEDDDGNCIVRENCPCLFSGAIYSDGRIIQRDCNKCTCQGGSWNCTNKVCPKTCEVYGDGHYITFDGKRYVYDGNCEYIFVEDQCNRREGTLQILTESVPCCEKGMTCSRNIRILLEGKELILTDNHVETVERFTNQTHCSDDFYSRHTIGLYLIIKFSNGITVIWDKSTRLSITLDSRWKNKVCGLCGNFNDDVSDDLTTKGNSLVTSAVEFGNSWKSMICSDTVNQTSPCDRNPYCLAWAQRKCGIIKHDMFQSCHKKVDPTPFYDACVQEACACDLEGKYLGFCTAVAVYAEACNKAGVCVDWRTPERCPVYCDYYNTPGECSWHYRPCGTLTAKTCSDHYIGKKFSAVLEGCYAKCPENAPYLDENRMKCVNLSECTCYYNGKILEAGERSNDCRYCVCIDGNVNCTGITFTTTEMSAATSLLRSFLTTESDCDGEWSMWFNENTPTLQNRADTELLNQMHSPLCPFSPYKITAIRCEALKFAQLPISEMKDNVTCDKETGLVCTYNPQNSEGDLTCLDYRIRVCCQPLLTSTSATTQTTGMTRNITIQTTSIVTTEQTTPTSTVTTEQTTPTTTVTTEQTTPTFTVTTEQTTPTTTITTEQPTPTTTVTTEQTTPTSTVTTEQTTPTTTVTTEQTTPTTTVTTEQTPTSTVTTEHTPITTVTTEQTTPTTTVTTELTRTTTVTTEQTTPTTTVTTEQTTPTTTITTEQTTPTTTITTEQTTPTTTVTTEQTTPTTTVTTEQTTPTTTVTTEQTTPTPTVTTEQTTPTTTVTTEHTIPTTTVTTEQTTPTTTVTTELTPTTTVTTEQTTPTTTVTTEQTTPTTTVTTEQTTPTTTVTTEQTTPTTTVTTEQTTPTFTVTTEQTPTYTVTTEHTPITTVTTEQTTPTTTVTTELTPTTTVTTEQTTPTTTVTTEQTTPTTTVTTEQTTPTTTVTTEQTTPTFTVTTEQTPTSTVTTEHTPITTVTTEQTTPTTTVTTELTPTTTVTTEQTTPTTTVTTEQTTPTTTVTTEQTTPTTTVTTEQTTPTTTVTTELTPTTTVTTEQTTHTTTVTTEQITPTTTVTTEQTTPTTTVTTEQTTPTFTVTTEQTPTSTVTTEHTPITTVTTEHTTPTTTVTTELTPTTTVTTEQTTPTTTVTTEQTTPTTTITTEQTTPTTTVTTEQTIPTTTVTTEQTIPTTTVTTEQTTPTTTVTTEQTTPTTTVTTEQKTPTTTVSTEQTTPTTTVSTEQTTPTTTVTTEQTTPTTTVTTEQTTPTTTVTTELTPTTTVTTEQTTPTTTVTTEQTTPTTTVTTEQTTPTTAVTTEQTIPTTTVTTEQTTPTTTVTTEQTPTSTVTTEHTPITTVTTEHTTPTTTVTTEQTIPTTTVTTEQTIPTTTVTTEQTTPTTTVTTEQTPTSTVTTEQTTTVSTSATELPTTPCYSGPKPTCLKPSKIVDANGCPKWDCYCQCQVWGDPHYLTFGGTQYDFFDNCTYTLMEERVPKYNFSVQVDNYYCFPHLPMSCAREITMYYNESVVTITTGVPQIITFDGESVTVPYSLNGINIHSKRQNIFISIPDIQASIIAFGDSFRIRLSQKYFLNNTQGQCGSCVDESSVECARRNGEILPPDCCHITANDWKVFDPKKPYCQSTPTNLPCTTSPPPPSTCHPGATLCELLLGKAFEDCRKQNQEDFDLFYNSCLFDHCHTNSSKFDCSSLQASAIACADRGICVDWRNFTNGQCNYTCPEGFIYKSCEHQDNDCCENNTLISGQELYPLSEGCFCPQGMMLSENMTTCVNTCCTDSSGDPKNEGETWSDPTNECIINTCLNSQVVASEYICCQGGRSWKINHCSESCRKQYGHCETLFISKNITMENSSCSAEVLMRRCEGNCPGWSEFDTATNTMINECGCCQPTAIENKTVILHCESGDNMPYNYTDIKSCNCIGNTCYNQNLL